jgi:hypothetical protein
METDLGPGARGGAVELRLEPAAVRPAQLVSLQSRTSMPARRLMLAVLADAVGAFRRTAGATDRAGQRLFVETAQWFASDDAGGPFTFVSICDTLGLDVEYVRAGLKRWSRRQRTVGDAGVLLARLPRRRQGAPARRVSGEPAGAPALRLRPSVGGTSE